MSKTFEGLEHNAIDLIAAAILNYEDNKVFTARKLLMEAIGIVMEMRILHDQLTKDNGNGKGNGGG